MTQSNPEQRAEAARLLAHVTKGDAGWHDEQRLLKLLPALLADAEALAARETMDEARRARVRRPVPARLVLDEHGSLWRERADV
jgi:hypothetical protein